MKDSISSTSKPHRMPKIFIKLNNSKPIPTTQSILINQFSERNKINKQYSQQIHHNPTKQLPSFFQSNLQSSRIADSKAIKLAENELQEKYKCDLSGYLRKKFKKYLCKLQEIDHRQPLMATNISRSSSEEQKSTNIRKFLTLQKYDNSKYQKSTIVNEAYLLNAKERIDRMVALKKQREDYYTDIRLILKKKLVEKARIRQKTEWQGEKRKEEEWQKKWISQYINEKSRYRKRLANKSINKRYHLSP